MKTSIFRGNHLQNFGYFIATQCFSVCRSEIDVFMCLPVESQVNSHLFQMCVVSENIFLHTNAIKSE